MTGKGYRKERGLQGNVTERRGVDRERLQKGVKRKGYRKARGLQDKEGKDEDN